MAFINEDLQAIAALLDEKINPLKADMQELKTDVKGLKTDIHNLSDRMEVLEIKQEITTQKVEDLTFRVASLEHTSKKESRKFNDQIETLIAVLEAKSILPKQA